MIISLVFRGPIPATCEILHFCCFLKVISITIPFYIRLFTVARFSLIPNKDNQVYVRSLLY